MKNLVRAALLGCMAAWVSLAQVNTISAKPGALNYVEGSVLLNGQAVSSEQLRNTFLNSNDVLSTDAGKAEVLLTPGVFLRVGGNSEFRMVSPSLTDTQVELTRGELMIEATGLVPENHLQVIDHGSITSVIKNGLYRFTADNPPLVAVFEGKAQVDIGDHKVDLKKGRQAVLADNSKPEKFDTKQGDDLYSWSNVRSEYEAASSYRVAQSASAGTLGYGRYGYGPGGYGSGWYWDSGFNSYAWLPGAGAFFSPFGYGFYSPGLVGYAPVIYSPLYYRGYPYRNGRDGYHGPAKPTGVTRAAVPVRPSGVNSFVGGNRPVSASRPGFSSGAAPRVSSGAFSAPHISGGGGGGFHGGGGGGRGR